MPAPAASLTATQSGSGAPRRRPSPGYCGWPSEVHPPEIYPEHLRSALKSRAVVDAAVALIMVQNRCSREQAMELLHLAARATDTKLHTIAADILQGRFPTPGGSPAIGWEKAAASVSVRPGIWGQLCVTNHAVSSTEHHISGSAGTLLDLLLESTRDGFGVDDFLAELARPGGGGTLAPGTRRILRNHRRAAEAGVRQTRAARARDPPARSGSRSFSTATAPPSSAFYFAAGSGILRRRCGAGSAVCRRSRAGPPAGLADRAARRIPGRPCRRHAVEDHHRPGDRGNHGPEPVRAGSRLQDPPEYVQQPEHEDPRRRGGRRGLHRRRY